MSELIVLDYEDRSVSRDVADGYFDATSMCQAMGKLLKDWKKNHETSDYLAALSFDLGVPVHCLIRETRTARGHKGHTFIHPLAAIRLAQWLSPEFAVQVDKWVHSGRVANRTDENTISGRLEQMSILAKEIEYHIEKIQAKQRELERLGFKAGEGFHFWLPSIKVSKKRSLGAELDFRIAMNLLEAAPLGCELSPSGEPVRFSDGSVWVGQGWLYKYAPLCGSRIRPHREEHVLRRNGKQIRFWRVNMKGLCESDGK